jgi:hypothetical protein
MPFLVDRRSPARLTVRSESGAATRPAPAQHKKQGAGQAPGAYRAVKPPSIVKTAPVV